MDNKRKKELREQYKDSKSTMGIYQIKNHVTEKVYLGITQDLRGTINGSRFKLNAGAFKDRELQNEWRDYGEDKFDITIFSELEYDKDESKTDYKEDLLILRELVSSEIENKKFI